MLFASLREPASDLGPRPSDLGLRISDFRYNRPTMTEQPASPTPVVPTPEAHPMGPIASGERVELIDIVRGVALFGILAANIRGFAGPALAYFQPLLVWPSMPDRIAQAFIDVFVQGKFITIFSFLFGLGFAVQLTRADEKGARFGGFFARRLAILALMGLAHGLYVWFGDILLGYALIGFLLFFFKRRKDKTLVGWAVVLYFVPMMLMGMGVLAIELTGKQVKGPDQSPAEVARQVELFSSGTYGEIQPQRAKDAVANNWGFMPIMAFQLLALFLMGILAWRHGVFTPSPETIPKYRKVMILGFVIGVTGNAIAIAIKWIYEPTMFPPSPTMLLIGVIQTFSIVPLSAGYVCSVILLCQDPAWHRRLAPFGAVGRTALTNYLLQSVIGTLLFYGYGLGLFMKMGPALLLVPTVVIFAIQVAASNWWLARFRFGPAEWLWRCLTYGKLQPLRR